LKERKKERGGKKRLLLLHERTLWHVKKYFQKFARLASQLEVNSQKVCYAIKQAELQGIYGLQTPGGHVVKLS
jgi:hypothetical protein